MSSPDRPPFYILVAHNAAGQPQSSSNLRHPAIQYHYADDSPLSMLPQHPQEQVIVLDYPEDGAPTARSISDDIVVTGLKVEEAPGAGTEDAEGKNDKMFVIETLRDER